jgi:hypothetical protein
MQKRKLVIGIAAVVVLVAGWAAFRPELLFIDSRVDEKFPEASARAEEATVLARGEFRGLAHETKGAAAIHEVAGGKRILRFTGFETSNGPALHVYLVAAADAPDNDTVKNAGFVDLGALKGNVGDQNYDIPAGTDLAKYRAVTIWCQRFGVNFGTAPLAGADSASAGAGGLRPISSGTFRGLAHETKGKAAIYELGQGKRVLRLTGFETSNGPALHVYLVAAADAPDNDTVKDAGFVDLGALKGNVGDQNYDVPAGTDLAKYRAVTVWCQRFGVNFGTASLAVEMQ